jgi:hypothetical protein
VQPKVTLFDGIFKPENPYIQKIDTAYRDFALSLREGQCLSCHVPNNPSKMSRLVLLQTPAHAAAEIKRVVASVKKGTMPIEPSTGMEKHLVPEVEKRLLAKAETFEQFVEKAKAWEASQAQASLPARKAEANTSQTAR